MVWCGVVWCGVVRRGSVTHEQELASLHSPQAGFLSRYMGQPYAARANSM